MAPASAAGGVLPRGLLLLCGMLVAAAAPAAAFNCKLGCPAATQPVCGANGVSYMSACIAACSGGQKRTTPGYCPGDKLRFAPPGAGSASALAKERAVLVPSAVMGKFAEHGFAYVGHAPLSSAPLRRKVAWVKEAAFKAAAAARSAGAATASRLAGVAAQRSSAAAKAAAAPAPPFDGGAIDSVSSFQPATSSGQQFKVEVLRGDRFGNVFYKTYMYDPGASKVYEYHPELPPATSHISGAGADGSAGTSGVSQGSPTGTEAAIFLRPPSAPAPAPAPSVRSSFGAMWGAFGQPRSPASAPAPPPARTGRRLAAAGAKAAARAAGAASDAAALHRMLSVIGPDTRTSCPIGRYPLGAMGQLSARAADGTFLCSGALIGPDRVLTAAHCVWDDRQARSFFKELSFSPAQWKASNGAVSAPEGRVDWEYVTTFKAYIDDPDLPPGLQHDIAVIKLIKPLGLKYGWLGMRAEPASCAGSSEAVNLTLAGYPGDDPFNKADDNFLGGCFYDSCKVTLKCGDPMTSHDCDSYIGQSGAPMYDPQYYVRMVHTLGVLQGISSENSGVTITKFMLDNVLLEWNRPRLDFGG